MGSTRKPFGLAGFIAWRSSNRMTEKKFSCQNCGAPLSNYAQAEIVRCKYCGTAFGGDEQELESLQNETPSHEFKEPPEIEVTAFEKRTMRWAIDAISSRLISSVVGACLPYVILIAIALVLLIGVMIWAVLALVS